MKKQAKRVFRELTVAERERVEAARRDVEARKEEILAQARVAKAAWRAKK